MKELDKVENLTDFILSNCEENGEYNMEKAEIFVTSLVLEDTDNYFKLDDVFITEGGTEALLKSHPNMFAAVKDEHLTEELIERCIDENISIIEFLDEEYFTESLAKYIYVNHNKFYNFTENEELSAKAEKFKINFINNNVKIIVKEEEYEFDS